MATSTSPATLLRRTRAFTHTALHRGTQEDRIPSQIVFDALDLGSAAGYGAANGLAINQRGQVTGNMENLTSLANEAFLWTHGGTDGAPDDPQIRPLGNLSGRPDWIYNGSMASGINYSAQVVGWADGADQLVDYPHACLWQPDGSVVDMGTLMQDNSMESRALGINNIGKVVGWSDTEFGTLVWFKHRRPFFYDLSSRTMVDLGIDHCEAVSINDWNEIAGAYQPDEYTEHAVYWDQHGNAWDIHSLVTAGGSSSRATAINDRGQIVGWADEVENGNYRGFCLDTRTWAVKHAWVPAAFGTRQTQILGINNRGQAVGKFRATATGYRALLWDVEQDVAENLNDRLPPEQQWPTSGLPEEGSVWALWEAWGINDIGQIVGQGQHAIDGQPYTRSYRLTPRSEIS